MMDYSDPKRMILRAIEEFAGVLGVVAGTANLAGRTVTMQAGISTGDAASFTIIIASISAGMGVITTRLLEAYRGFQKVNAESAHVKLSVANREIHELVDRNSKLERSAKSMAETIEWQQRTISEMNIQIGHMHRAKDSEPAPP